MWHCPKQTWSKDGLAWLWHTAVVGPEHHPSEQSSQILNVKCRQMSYSAYIDYINRSMLADLNNACAVSYPNDENIIQ